MLAALGGAAMKYAAPMALNTANTFVQGKIGENIGDRNVAEAFRIGQQSRSMNEDPNVQGNRSAQSVTASQEGANARSMGREAFLNQMTQANKRADNEDQRTTYEQDNAFRRGETLANNYANAAMNQAQSNNNVLATMLGVSGQARR